MGFQTYTANLDDEYTDLDLDFFANPNNGDVILKYGADAIKRSVRNLIFTNYYERFFRSNVGSDATGLLFELNDPFTSVYLQNAISKVINIYEPRVKLNNVKVSNDIDNNGFNVTLEYTIVNGSIQTIVTLFLERIR